MFNIRIGKTKFDIYIMLDANEVMLKLHRVMKILCYNNSYKTIIANIEKYEKYDDKSIDDSKTIDTYTLIILKSPRHLTTNEIALLFKEVFKRYKAKNIKSRNTGWF